MFPERTQQGLRQIEELGYRWKMAPHALEFDGFVSSSPQNRASDLHALFADTEVTAIMAAIGGDHSCHMLPFLDFDLIARNPKILIGFSDTVVLLNAIHAQTGLVTFNGPALLTDLAEYPGMLPYTLQAFQKVLTRPEPAGEMQPSSEWTVQHLDWADPTIWRQPRQMQPSDGWAWLKPGQASGRLIGGCIESLQHLRGTRYWPDWTNAVFFWETSEDAPSPATVDGILMDYQNMGVLDRIAGMLVGRPMRYSREDRQELLEIILRRTQAFSFPIIAEMDFGHTAPQLTLPIGCRVEIDSHSRLIKLAEAAVR